MDDLIKSLKAQLYDRVTSPLLSTFLISWALWNHRLFVVLISSDMKIKEKFAYVDDVMYPHFWDVAGRGFLWPLGSALFLLFVYPIPGRWVYRYVRTQQALLKKDQQRIEDEIPVLQEEAKELRAALRKANAEFAKEVSERDATIASLRRDMANQESRDSATITNLMDQLAQRDREDTAGRGPST